MKKILQKASSSPQSSTPMSSNSNISTEFNDIAVSLNKLTCNSIEKSSPNDRGQRAVWEEGFDLAGKGAKVMKEKGPKGGWAAETGKQGKGVWEREKDDWGRGWEKVKGGWGRGKGKIGWRGGKGHKKKCSLLDGFDDDMSPDCLPYKKRTFTKTYSKQPGNQVPSMYTQPDQKLRGTKQNLIITQTYDIEHISEEGNCKLSITKFSSY